MTTRSGPGPGRSDPGLSAITSERHAPTHLAYRVLGSLAEAEDAVQEAGARWYALQHEPSNRGARRRPPVVTKSESARAGPELTIVLTRSGRGGQGLEQLGDGLPGVLPGAVQRRGAPFAPDVRVGTQPQQ